MNKEKNINIIISSIFGILTGLSFCFGNPFFLIFIGFFSNIIYKEKINKFVFIYSFFYMSGLITLSLFWMFGVFDGYSGEINLKKMHLPMLFMFQSLLFSFFIVLIKMKNSKKSFFPIMFASGWVFFEYNRGFLLGGNSWINIGSVGIDIYGIEILYSIFGELGVSFFLVYIISTICLFNKKSALVVFIILIFILLINEKNINNEEKRELLDVKIIQPNITEEEKWSSENLQKILEDNIREIKSSEESVIVFPETSFPLQYEAISYQFDDIVKHLKNKEKTIISGIFKATNDKYLNPMYTSTISVDNSGVNFFHKEKMIPLFEENTTYDWLYKLLGFKYLGENGVISYKGSQENIKIKEKIKIATSICYEITYSELIRNRLEDANILFLISNMGSFKSKTGQEQQFKIARVRAAENGKFIVVSSNTGVSGIIDNYGRVIKRGENFVKTYLKGDVSLIKEKTFFNKYGYKTLFFLIFILIGINLIKKENKK